MSDTIGNVMEWCEDWFGDYSNQRVIDPQGPDKGSYRVLRGGSLSSNARFCRSSCLNWYVAGSRYDDVGFRVARGQDALQSARSD